MFKPTGYAILLLVLALGACMPLGKKGPPPVVYQLKAPERGVIAQPPALPAGTAVEVLLPTVPAGYDRDRIALSLDGGRRLDYYSAAKWPEELPDVLQDIVSRSLRQSLPGLVIDDEGSLPTPTHILRVEVVEFTPVYPAAATTIPTVQVALRFALSDVRRGAVLLDMVQKAEVMPEANSLGAVVAALEMGLHRTLSDATPRLAGTLAPPRSAKR